MPKNKLIYLIATSILVVAVLYFFDQVMTLNYLSKIALKTALFVTFPMIYTIQTGENVFKSSIANIKSGQGKRGGWNAGVLLGAAVFAVILVVYIFMRRYVDSTRLILEFQDKYKINSGNIVYYSIYLAFVNSFLEEFFFRGFLFLNIKRLGFTKAAYAFSALLFAVYHIANFQNWLFPAAFILALAGLFAGGCLFNYLDDRQETFLNSWFVHICADLAIVLIGLQLFGIIEI